MAFTSAETTACTRLVEVAETEPRQKPCMKQPVLSQRMIVALDAARAAAAIYVVLYHLTLEHHLQHGIGMIFALGQEAVIVFFLLSGFVIFANERDRLTRPGGYYLRRFRRIYPPLIVAMLVSTLIYLDDGLFLESFKWRDLIGTLLMVQDISSGLRKAGVPRDYVHAENFAFR